MFVEIANLARRLGCAPTEQAVKQALARDEDELVDQFMARHLGSEAAAARILARPGGAMPAASDEREPTFDEFRRGAAPRTLSY